MIRVRLGQSWKREPTAAPVDSVGLVVDGVDLITGASEETLTQVLPDAVAAAHALARQGKRFAQFSVPEAHFEVLLRRAGTSAELTVVDLGRPARVVRGPL